MGELVSERVCLRVRMCVSVWVSACRYDYRYQPDCDEILISDQINERVCLYLRVCLCVGRTYDTYQRIT